MNTHKPSQSKAITLAVDVMGADRGVKPLIKGLSYSYKKNPNLRFLIFGDQKIIAPILRRDQNLQSVSEIHHCDNVVSMTDKPSQVMRRGKGTSMYSAIEAVKEGHAQVAVSCGNTGALMALSMLILRKAPMITRPAIAILWPSKNPQGFNIMLDAGADVSADANDLFQHAVMGASYARNLFGIAKPRIGLLNVGTEEGKGRQELAEAAQMIEAQKDIIGLKYAGYIEGADIGGNQIDVIVTDGFTGNIALKTAEGVARYVRDNISAAFRSGLLARFGAIFAYPALRSLKKRLDPRRSNGGVFLGLNGTVIKSHGSSDAVSFSAAIKLAATLGKQDFSQRLNDRLHKVLEETKGSINE